LAYKFNLPNKDRKDSQGICFLGKFKYRDFLKHYLGVKVGNLVEKETGNIMGTHDGFWFYTPGQRQGIGLSGGPWYVVGKNIDENVVFISKNYYGEEHKRDHFIIDSCNWFSGSTPSKTSLEVKTRHGPHRHSCQIVPLNDGTVEVRLLAQDQGIAPGQFAVFYEGDLCLGGGIIC
jgi:tRNA-specific 2-thiouridylase